MKFLKYKLIVIFVVSLISSNVLAKNEPSFFASLKVSEVNVRTGPGIRYPIKWIYKKKYLPIEIKGHFDNWYHIVDEFGEKGWVHENLVSHARYFKVKSPQSILYRKPGDSNYPIALVSQGVRGRLLACRDLWCQVKINEDIGWLRKDNLWGVYPYEEF